ncbi:MAG TPA: hypothetical protein DDY18_09090 [Flavobacterium sp.]|nr:hypothetical protein [Flavobacterium sp.]
MKAKFNIILLFIFLGIIGSPVKSQINVNAPIILNSTDSSNRLINNVPMPQGPTEILNNKSIQSGSLLWGTPVFTGTDSIHVQLYPNLDVADTGTTIVFKLISLSSGTKISVNGLNYYTIWHPSGRPILPGDLTINQTIILTFSGGRFDLIFPIQVNCPNGYIKVNDEYCIRANEYPTNTFFSAINTCYDQNARLCTWSEFHYACQKGISGLNTMTNNWEWVDDSGNEPQGVRVVGNGGCNQSNLTYSLTTTGVYNTRNFRCCYSLK